MRIVSFEDGKVDLYVQDRTFIELRIRDKSSTKIKFYKEMMYVYNVCDYNAQPSREGFNEIDTHRYSVEASGLDSTYIPDELVKKAIHRYFQLRDTVSIKYIKELLKSMKTSLDIVTELNKLNIDMLKEVKELPNDKENLPDKINLINTLVKNQDILFTLSSKAEEQTATLETLNDRIKVEEEKQEKSLGGDDVTDSMLPYND
jgi:hypothetical protein